MLCMMQPGAQAIIPGAGTIQSEIEKQYIDDKIERKFIQREIQVDENKKGEKPEKVKKTPVKDKENEFNPLFKHNKINFEGNTIYSDKELSDLASNIIGQEIYIDDVVKLASVITRKYHYDGYITSFAYLPVQDSIDGVLTIKVVESKVTDIQVSGNKWSKKKFYSYAVFTPSNLKKGRIFNIADMDAAIKNLEDEVYVKGNFEVTKENNIEDSIVHLTVKDRVPLTFNVGVDNHGRNFVGENRLSMLLTDENVTGFGDKAYGGVILASRTTGAMAGYSVPISPYGTRLSFDYGYTNVRIGKELSSYSIRGASENYLIKVTQPIKKSSDTTIEASLGVDFSNTTSNSNALGEKLSDYSLSVLRATIYGEHDDKYGRSLAILNGDFGLTSSLGTAWTGPRPDTNFVKAAVNLVRLQKVPIKDSYLVLRVGGQYSPNVLYPIEQMQLGGYNSVRGYETGALIGDYGCNGSIELRTPIPGLKKVLPEKYKDVANRVKFVTFYDFGYIKEHAHAYNYTKNFFQSVGCGVSVFTKNGISVNVAAGIPIGSSDYTNGSVRIHFSISSSLDRLIFHKFHSTDTL